MLYARCNSSLPASKLRNFREGRRYIDAGEAAVQQALPQLQAAIPWLLTELSGTGESRITAQLPSSTVGLDS